MRLLKDPNWRPAFIYLLDNVWKEQEIQKVPSLYLRDFPADDVELQEFLTDQGFVRIKMPNTHIIHDLSFNNVMDYLTTVGVKRRGHIKKDVLNLIDYFDVEIKTDLPMAEIDKLYQLYLNVSKKNFEINTFELPKLFFNNISRSPDWEIITLRIKKNYLCQSEDLTVAVVWAYKNENYYPSVIGINYDYISHFKVYKQMLFRILERAIDLKCKKVYFGLTASLEKRKLGAIIKEQVAYIQHKDQFMMSMVEIEGNNIFK